MSENMLTRGLRDGAEVHKAALRSGLNTRLLPRQVLQVFNKQSATSFTHGIPQASTLAGVTFTQDLRMRRGLLGKAGVLQPRGATFSIGKKRNPIRKFARQLGYPVVIKPALGDSTIDVFRGIRSSKGLDRALNKLMVPPDKRPGSTKAAYGITELRAPGRYKGRPTVPPGYRVLVEEQLSGRYLRILVLGGCPINAIALGQDPWGDGTQSILLEELPKSVLETVEKVVTALPGLHVLNIDLVVSEGSRRTDHSGAVRVVDVSERPWLEVQHRLEPELCERLADQILQASIDLGDHSKAEPIQNSMVHFKGIVAPDDFCRIVPIYATGRGVCTNLQVTSLAKGEVHGTMEGTSHAIAELLEILVDVGVDGQSAMQSEFGNFGW